MWSRDRNPPPGTPRPSGQAMRAISSENVRHRVSLCIKERSYSDSTTRDSCNAIEFNGLIAPQESRHTILSVHDTQSGERSRGRRYALSVSFHALVVPRVNLRAKYWDKREFTTGNARGEETRCLRSHTCEQFYLLKSSRFRDLFFEEQKRDKIICDNE